MSFCNIEYLQERLAAVCKERDEYKSLLDAAISAQESLQKELDHVNHLLAMARAERDANVKRMIECEKELHETKSELDRLRGSNDGI